MANSKANTGLSSQSLDEMLGDWREQIKGKQRGLYTFENIVDLKLKELKARIYSEVVPADEWMMKQVYFRGVGRYEDIDKEFKPIKVGETWGGEDVSCFFKQKIKIPPEMKGKKVVLLVYFGGDSLLSLNGVPHQGMDPMRNLVFLTDCAKGDEEYEVNVESYYMWHAGEPELKRLECSNIAAVDTEIERIYWNYKSAFNGFSIINISDELNVYLKDALKEAIEYIRPELTDRNEFLDSLEKGDKILRDKIYNCDKFKVHGKLALVGNSHLDVVFLWTYDEFVRKLGRTHATMLRLMEQYPRFIFTQSQPLMYKEMKKNYPALYEQVKQRVKEGRWEVIGGMWVEPDCNLISGESMTRQILFGKRFYQGEFGVDTRTCWLPDVFGNCYTMPQILKKSGIDYFVTHKMGVWNDTNPWKHHTFLWEGPDGSRVFAVQPPTHFIGTMEPDHLSLNWSRFSDKQTVGESIFCYGWGDGGGGVDSEMLEYVERYSKFPGLPETEPIKAQDALKRMMENSKNLPVWKDELYLEAHRGVHTTKGLLKKLNRYCENLYREAEIYSSIAASMGFEYPQEKINAGWEKVLTNQFHDSLPGSHITKVYYELLKEYEAAVSAGESIRNAALDFISNNAAVPKQGNKKAILVYNSLPFESSRIAYLDAGEYNVASISDCEGSPVDFQLMKKLDGTHKIVFLAENVPAVGYKQYYIEEGNCAASQDCSCRISSELMENDFFKLSFNKEGEITSIYDKAEDREVLAENGKGNVFKLYEDIPSKYEAWDIVETYLDKEYPTEAGTVEVSDLGAVFCSVILTKHFFNSKLTQKIIIYNKIPRIDFETHIDWMERRKLLKVGFEVDVTAKEYTSDIAYGNIQRPAYRSNSFDKAKFEVSAHNWIDLSDSGYGVSILNDCKYGYDVKENKMSITLLKGPTNPDPESDIGIQYFTYSLFPHNGTWREAGTNEKGLEFNNPVIAKEVSGEGKALPLKNSFIGISDRNIALEAVKKAEDSKDFIVRVVERYGKNTKANISFFADITKVFDCDLMESELSELSAEGRNFEFTIKPYEIKTFKISIL